MHLAAFSSGPTNLCRHVHRLKKGPRIPIARKSMAIARLRATSKALISLARSAALPHPEDLSFRVRNAGKV